VFWQFLPETFCNYHVLFDNFSGLGDFADIGNDSQPCKGRKYLLTTSNRKFKKSLDIFAFYEKPLAPLVYPVGSLPAILFSMLCCFIRQKNFRWVNLMHAILYPICNLYISPFSFGMFGKLATTKGNLVPCLSSST
jgi:hypothetical protein